jgi:hypothetical protein
MAVATNLGTGGAVLDAQFGSAPTPNTNEPLLLPHTGENYLYLSGVAGNSLTCTAPATATNFVAYPLGGGTTTTGAASGGATFTFSTVGSWVRVDLLTAGAVVVASFLGSAITTGAATSQTDAYSVAWTINRSAAGRKSVAVVRPVWLLGTDDYFEVADNALLDFGAADSFTVVVVGRKWGSTLSMVLLAKSAAQTSTMTGWAVAVESVAASTFRAPLIGDGTTRRIAAVTGYTEGSLFAVAGVRDITADNLTAYRNGTAGTPVTDTTTGSLANNEVMRIGRLSGGGTDYADMELLAVAVFRRALTAAEIATIATYYGAS